MSDAASPPVQGLPGEGLPVQGTPAGGTPAGGLPADGAGSLGDAASHFTTEAGGEPAGVGRYVNIDTLTPVEFLPGLGFRPVLGQRAMTNFVTFEPGSTAPRHVHEEEQIVIVLEGELMFDLDGDVRPMRKGDVAVVPAWVPHAAWTTDSRCLEVDVFCPPRRSLLKLAEVHAAAQDAALEPAAGAPAAGAPDAGAPDASAQAAAAQVSGAPATGTPASGA
jgi:quercetin dioxygenase-like cupin family protein